MRGWIILDWRVKLKRINKIAITKPLKEWGTKEQKLKINFFY
jgi:hypothetical protein